MQSVLYALQGLDVNAMNPIERDALPSGHHAQHLGDHLFRNGNAPAVELCCERRTGMLSLEHPWETYSFKRTALICGLRALKRAAIAAAARAAGVGSEPKNAFCVWGVVSQVYG